MNPTHSPEIFLKRQGRRTRGALLAWALATALLSDACYCAARLGWNGGNARWASVPAVVAFVLLVLWGKRVWKLDRKALAREYDARWNLQSRLESAVELSAESSAVAAAQRADATQTLTDRKPSGTLLWLCGIAAALIALGLAGIENVAWLSRAQHPPPPVPSSPKTLAVAPAARPLPPEPLRASIVWKSPPKVIETIATDEVPLSAFVKSNKGFRAISLEIEVNGVHTNAYPLGAGAIGTLAQPGERNLSLSLFLDETGAKADDVVSYYLLGEPKVATPTHPIVSSLQFIEVIPLPTKKLSIKPPASDARETLRVLDELKRAQLGLIERNFSLIHGGALLESPDWRMEAFQVASLQVQLAKQAAEARTLSLRVNAPGQTAADLLQAEPLMIQAGNEITAGNNQSAAQIQAQALSLISRAAGSSNAAANRGAATARESIRKRSDWKLPRRGQTPAGRLEALAQRQRDNNQRMGLERPAASRTANTSAAQAEQAAIARDAATLAAEKTVDRSAQKPTGAAASAAAEAAQQLGLGDPEAAREPAAEAQAAFEKAVQAQDNQGKKEAAAALEQIRRELNAASRSDDPADQKKQLAAARDELRAEAEQQQNQGSSEASQKLADLADQLDQPPEPQQSPKTPGSEAQQNQSQANSSPPQPSPPPSPSSSSPPGGGAAGTGTSSSPSSEIGSGSAPPSSLSSSSPGGSGADAPPSPSPGGSAAGTGTSPSPSSEIGSGSAPPSSSPSGSPGGSGANASPSPSARGNSTAGSSESSRGGGKGVPSQFQSNENRDLSAQAHQVAMAAAETQVSLSSGNAASDASRQLRAAARQLLGETASPNPTGLAAPKDIPAILATIESAAQESQLVPGEDLGVADELIRRTGGLFHARARIDPARLRMVIDDAQRLAAALERAQTGSKRDVEPAQAGATRDESVRRYAPEDIDPVYRKPVADYFENLSREDSDR